VAEAPPALGSDLWGRAGAQLARRGAFRWAIRALLLMATLAVYAPFLASDRPWYLEAVHRGEFERARATLVPVSQALAGLLARDEAAHLAARGDATQSLAEARAAEGAALRGRLSALGRALAREDRASLDALEAHLETVLRTADPVRASPEAGAALVEEARALRTALDPAQVRLVASTSFPLLAALAPFEAGLAVAWLGALGLASRRGRRHAAVLLGCALGAGLVVGLVWSRAVGGGDAFHTSPLKERLTSGSVEARHVVFAPVPYVYAEQNVAESLRPPTWLASSRLDDHGAYVSGARVPRPDAITGFVPVTQPVEVRAGEPALNSPWRHLLGTDTTGRDLLARVLHGARASLSVGFLAAVALLVVGIGVGAVAGTCGGRVDALLSRVIEVVSAVPLLFLVLVAVAFLGPSSWNVIVVLGCVGWTGVARLARTEFQRERELEYVSAARALGFSWPRVILVHILPNALAPLLVAATFAVAGSILVESALSFLGFGVRVPVASWGGLTNESRELANWWLQLFPGLFLFVTVLCVQLVGDALRDALDPRAQTRREPGRSGA